MLDKGIFIVYTCCRFLILFEQNCNQIATKLQPKKRQFIKIYKEYEKWHIFKNEKMEGLRQLLG